MKSVSQRIQDFGRLGIRLSIKDGHLRVSAPNNVLIPELVEELKTRKQEIMECLQKNSETSPLSITANLRADPLSLSYAQERLWFLDQLEGSSAVYNMPFWLRLSGALNVDNLEQALQDIVARHEVLRTRIVANKHGTPEQQITHTVLEMSRVTLDGIAIGNKSSLGQLIEQEASVAFELAADLKIRATLVSLSSDGKEDHHVLLITLHHIAADGWSIGVFWRELATLYNSHQNDQSDALPTLAIQYADYAQWQRNWLDDYRMGEQLDFWTNQLSGAPALLELPTDHARPATQTFNGDSHSLILSRALSAKIDKLSRNSGATLFMTLLSVFKLLLSRYSGQSDIVVGTPFANRTQVELEPMIGFFINTLALRTDLSGDICFNELLLRVRQTALSAYQFQEVPFEKVVEALQPIRSLSYSPLFQVMFVLQNAPLESLSMDGLTVDTMDVSEQKGHGVSKFDLTLSVAESPDGLISQFSYNTDLFEPATIARMAQHFQVLLQEIVLNPEQPISQLHLLTGKERHQLLIEWNDTAADYPRDNGLHELFEEQAAQTPDGLALVFEQEQVTYEELNIRANKLAHLLINSGVKRGSLVGICIDRSIEMVLGLVGILKAGGAYIPLDPHLPEERLMHMLTDSSCSLLLTQQRWVPAFSHLDLITIDIDSHHKALETQSGINPGLQIFPESLAYLIYTSGSTGTPKGSMITHRNLCNYFHWRISNALISSSDRVLQKTTLSFDVASSEIFAPLLAGGTLVIASPGIQTNLELLAKQVVEQRITLLNLPPSTLRLLIEDSNFIKNNVLRRVISGGEELNVTLKNRTLEKVDVELLNGYGPSETTIAVLFHCCKRGLAERSVAIGRPIANTQLYILDPMGQLLPAGHIGELYIGGDCVGSGYLNRPELTAESFLNNPFGAGRLYRSGDLVRYLPNSTGMPPEIEFVGRADTQIKIRGFRVELGEIEAALDLIAIVRDKVVIYDDVDGVGRIIAYVVVGCEFDAFQLRSFLSKKLPDYMVPSHYVEMDALPLTPHGKIDKAKLPLPGIQLRSGSGYAPPESEVEILVASVWSSLLDMDRVGLHDNFFTLGGHSLLAIKFIARIRNHYSICLPLTSIFEYSTVSSLSEYIDNMKWINELEQDNDVNDGEEGEI